MASCKITIQNINGNLSIFEQTSGDNDALTAWGKFAMMCFARIAQTNFIVSMPILPHVPDNDFFVFINDGNEGDFCEDTGEFTPFIDEWSHFEDMFEANQELISQYPEIKSPEDLHVGRKNLVTISVEYKGYDLVGGMAKPQAIMGMLLARILEKKLTD